VFGPDNPVDLVDDEPPPPFVGPLERAVRADLEALALVSPTAGSMEQLAYNLARKLDDGAGMATAAVAKELRETLAAMAEEAGDDDGSALLERLSTPMPPAVGNTPPA
jgi:hypothetical protein